MVIDHGRVVVAWGDVTRRFKVASARKSLVSAMYGPEVASGALRLDASLAELGVDDLGGLTATERGARLENLLAGRSGVYHVAAKEPPSMVEARPERGSHPPGTFMWYNNWDFNVAGQLLARAAGKSLGELFDERLAQPLAMEDWRPGDGWDELEPSVSRWAAWEFRVSTRDLARFGRMVLQRGVWESRQVVSADWLDRSIRPVSDFGDGVGYGYMWWVNPGRTYFRPQEPVERILTEPHFAAIGAGGHACIVFPRLDLVIVHRGDSDNGPGVPEEVAFLVADRILAARRDGPRPADAAVVAVTPIPFPNALPPPVERTAIAIDATRLQRYVGEYALPRGGVLTVIAYEGRLFGSIPGRNQVELLAESPTRFFARSVPVLLEFVGTEVGTAQEVVIDVRGQSMRAKRADPTS
jgi:CubicO group peptidase (beta-lactamase class C family)